MNEWIDGCSDEKTLNRIMASEYKLYGICPFDKPPVTRETWMINAIQHLKMDSVHCYTMKVDVVENVAIVQSKFYWQVLSAINRLLIHQSILVDTWVKRQ